MTYSKKQAAAKAKQIFDSFGLMIHRACLGSGVAEDFLAGFVGVEAGIDAHGTIKPNATRFEKGVFADLVSLRDHGYCFVGGRKRTNYSGVTQAQIKDADDTALRALATSYGMSQIMGWHVINNLHCTIADLRDVQKHFFYTIQLLMIGESGTYLKRGDLKAVLHIWNTGSANGKTYHEDYVENALSVKQCYAEILKQHPDAFSNDIPDPAGNVSQDAGISPAMSDTDAEDETNGGSESDDADSTPQIAENITNVNNGSSVPDNFVPEDKSANAPAKEGATQTAGTMTILGIAVPVTVSGILAAIKSAFEQGFIDGKQVFETMLKLLSENIHFVFYLVGLIILLLIVKKVTRQITLWIEMYIKGRADMHNVEVKAQ